MASLTRWTWVWVNSGSWWWTGRPGVLWFMGLQTVGHNWVTDLIWSDPLYILKMVSPSLYLFFFFHFPFVVFWKNIWKIFNLAELLMRTKQPKPENSTRTFQECCLFVVFWKNIWKIFNVAELLIRTKQPKHENSTRTFQETKLRTNLSQEHKCKNY